MKKTVAKPHLLELKTTIGVDWVIDRTGKITHLPTCNCIGCPEKPVKQ